MSRNRLADQASPYLLQHRDNPVHWWPWGPAALEAAQAENKPILLSVGYAACHWCHVMAHESFEDAEVAAKMNARFINIKVDREERPDIDHIYQTALAALGQQGGWPLTMFLTPEGAPFWGGTYFPKQPRYGRPAFVDILDRLADAYQAQEDAVLQNRDALLGAVKNLTEQARPGMITVKLLDPMARRLLQHMDPKHGGLSGAPKFPQAAIFELLWRAYWRTGDETFKTAFAHTLTRIAQGGIYDHLGGGFARYSVDDIWLAPHFEKMLYDNAQLIDLYTQAWADTADPLFAARVSETIAWFRREMLADGGFTASLDADSEGVEGKFYVWDKAEVDALLGPDSDFFCRYYDIREDGNWEGHNIPNRLRQIERLSDKEEARLKACRETLFKARAKRVRPGWDDKVLADWSGLMIAALVRAAMVFDRPDWLDLAKAGYDFVIQNMMNADSRLAHSFRAGQTGPMGLLEDYASMALAALKLYMATGDRTYFDQALSWAAIMARHFKDPARGGYFQTADDAEKLIARPRPSTDHATPSGNGLSAKLLVWLHHLTGDAIWAETAERLFNAFGGEMERNFLGCASLLHAFEDAAHPVEILIHGEAEAGLIRAVWKNTPPSAIIQKIDTTLKLSKDHPAAHIDPAAPPAIYICENRVCSLPLRTAEEIAQRLHMVKGWALKQA